MNQERDNRHKPGEEWDYPLGFCFECGEGYEVGFEHIHRRKNSYPMHTVIRKDDPFFLTEDGGGDGKAD